MYESKKAKKVKMHNFCCNYTLCPLISFSDFVWEGRLDFEWEGRGESQGFPPLYQACDIYNCLLSRELESNTAVI